MFVVKLARAVLFSRSVGVSSATLKNVAQASACATFFNSIKSTSCDVNYKRIHKNLISYVRSLSAIASPCLWGATVSPRASRGPALGVIKNVVQALVTSNDCALACDGALAGISLRMHLLVVNAFLRVSLPKNTANNGLTTSYEDNSSTDTYQLLLFLVSITNNCFYFLGRSQLSYAYCIASGKVLFYEKAKLRIITVGRGDKYEKNDFYMCMSCRIIYFRCLCEGQIQQSSSRTDS